MRWDSVFSYCECAQGQENSDSHNFNDWGGVLYMVFRQDHGLPWRYMIFDRSREFFIFFQSITIWQTFIWSYGDAFISMLAVGVSHRFNQINDYLKRCEKDNTLMKPSTWREIRLHYFKLIELVDFVNSQISWLIMITTGHNLLVLVLKTFNALRLVPKLLAICVIFDFLNLFKDQPLIAHWMKLLSGSS